ncbi:transposase [Streptomyces sp. Ag82_O1-15]|uniref:transposase n=1 Tax=Streptomyces sp. Ag82_O1-15 TaxID=1938855 RepID=UPI0015C7DF3F
MIAQTGRRKVTGGMLTIAGLARAWPHDRAHSFFSRAAWDAELVGIVLSHVVARLLVSEGAPQMAAVDDTRLKRSGKNLCSLSLELDHVGGGRLGHDFPCSRSWASRSAMRFSANRRLERAPSSRS